MLWSRNWTVAVDRQLSVLFGTVVWPVVCWVRRNTVLRVWLLVSLWRVHGTWAWFALWQVVLVVLELIYVWRLLLVSVWSLLLIFYELVVTRRVASAVKLLLVSHLLLFTWDMLLLIRNAMRVLIVILDFFTYIWMHVWVALTWSHV